MISSLILIGHICSWVQVLIAEPLAYAKQTPKPLWPPELCVRAIHWWGRTADNLVLARPLWFKVAIWLEVFVQAPFCARLSPASTHRPLAHPAAPILLP